MSVCKNPKENCMRYPSAWVMRFADELPARARVLDLACGEGRHTGLLSLIHI